NGGPTAATGVKVSDLLPVGLTFVSATPSQGSYSNATGILDAGAVATGGARAALPSRALVATPEATLHNAVISAADQFDPNPGNTSASATVTPQRADLALVKVVDNSTPNVGDTVTFTVTLTNNGPNAASNVKITDLLPTGLTFATATPSQGTY